MTIIYTDKYTGKTHHEYIENEREIQKWVEDKIKNGLIDHVENKLYLLNEDEWHKNKKIDLVELNLEVN